MLVGGIGGYLLADLIAWKVLEESFEEEMKEREDEEAEELFVGLREHMDGQREDKRIDYSKYTKPDLKELAVLAEVYETETAPYIISFDDWQDGALIQGQETVEEYDREVISYYATDGVFADEAEDEIVGTNDLFGPNIHLHFGEESQDPDVVYVLNPAEKTLFEIVRIHESYAVQVLGEEPPKKKPGRPRGSKNKKETDAEESTE
jgi:hypothetical protein